MKVIIFGGAGFIGCNTAKKCLDRGDRVIVVDNLSRKGTPRNLRWLRDQGKDLEFIQIDIRNHAEVKDVIEKNRDAEAVFHLAGQVAVTTSVTDPRDDFENNALGTFNILEAVREIFTVPSKTGAWSRVSDDAPLVIYSSTNKVYGCLEDVAVVEKNTRYEFRDFSGGISESRTLDFHSPYGCSKGAADQYIIDYSRIYGLKTVCFRQSCIYGYRQFGVEDQGWVAWFTIAAILKKPITLYGNGKQVRDVLFIDDLTDLYLKSIEKSDIVNGNVYNIGGGPENIMSVLELIAFLEDMTGRKISYSYAEKRPGDQCVYISDINRIRDELGWMPEIEVRVGVKHLYDWVRRNEELFNEI